MGMFAFNSILNGMIKFENIWKVLFLYQAHCAWYKSYADILLVLLSAHYFCINIKD